MSHTTPIPTDAAAAHDILRAALDDTTLHLRGIVTAGARCYYALRTPEDDGWRSTQTEFGKFIHSQIFTEFAVRCRDFFINTPRAEFDTLIATVRLGQ